LTVTYMNRPASQQVDTLEQRARAFGYRRSQLPYCQFFASKQTVRALREIVFTEYDLRAQLRDAIDDGKSVDEWAHEVGLLLPDGMKPTRDAVVSQLSKTPVGWQSLRRPLLDVDALDYNRQIVESTGIFDANEASFGRRSFRTLSITVEELRSQIIEPWKIESYSPSWRHDEIIQVLARHPDPDEAVTVLLMDEGGEPRIRKWVDSIGFINLFQGHDLAQQADRSFYPGDRKVPGIDNDPGQIALQVHRVRRRDDNSNNEILTLALYLGARAITRRI
jgi:hypothetical protein